MGGATDDIRLLPIPSSFLNVVGNLLTIDYRSRLTSLARKVPNVLLHNNQINHLMSEYNALRHHYLYQYQNFDQLHELMDEIEARRSNDDNDNAASKIFTTKDQNELAARLTEGVIRRLRYLVLEEAADLHEALRFWTSRYEHPLLSFLESGPQVIFSPQYRYDHGSVGLKVSQIQAVLARRIAVVGELQQHLNRAGWRRGVAQWAVLGEGGQWIVTGEDGEIEGENEYDSAKIILKASSEDKRTSFQTTSTQSISILRHSSTIGGNDDHEDYNQTSRLPLRSSSEISLAKGKTNYYGYSNIVVGNTRGGKIISDSSAHAAWSIDAMRVIRDQLYRAGHPTLELPFSFNWPQEQYYIRERKRSLKVNSRNRSDSFGYANEALPLWAVQNSVLGGHTESPLIENESNFISISDIFLLCEEVKGLINAMNIQMSLQRSRRLDKLKPPSSLKRNWFFYAMGAPVGLYAFYKLVKDRWGISLCRHFMAKMASFYAEHVREPITDIFNELFTSKERETITDQAAREEIEQSLRNMLRSWLDDQYPHTDEAWREERANKMDMSLIEKRKEDNVYNALKSTFTGDIIRMALIEAQFIKKELMQAMKGIDEVMDSNELNFRLAATAPALMLMYAVREAAQYLLYAFLKVGQSRASTYASIRSIILEIERLLVMRDCPPAAPAPLTGGVYSPAIFGDDSHFTVEKSEAMLNSDDLGMLLLLIHRCRVIILKNERRFSFQEKRNIMEDFAELSGERGCVSIKQQLKIVVRMGRVYRFFNHVS